MKLLTALLCTTLLLRPAFTQPVNLQSSFAAFMPHAGFGVDSTLPVWPKHKFSFTTPRFQSALLTTASLTESNRSLKAVLGFTKNNRPVELYYFPGTSNKKALVIGGVHGSELSAMDVVKQLLEELENGVEIYYSVVVIPCLFPDNAVAALQAGKEINSTKNIGRYSHAGAPDPNRQMPPLGKAFNPLQPLDDANREIERENQMLLHLIQDFAPDRIINVHAIRNSAKAGIFADPRTDCAGRALGYETDSLLALGMAQYIYKAGGNVSGNKLGEAQPTTLYGSDPAIAPKGSLQQRNLQGSVLPNNLGTGVSLGAWGTTAVCDEGLSQYNRPAMRVITVEFPGNKRPEDYTASERKEHEKQLQLYAAAISRVFLAQQFIEEDQ